MTLRDGTRHVPSDSPTGTGEYVNSSDPSDGFEGAALARVQTKTNQVDRSRPWSDRSTPRLSTSKGKRQRRLKTQKTKGVERESRQVLRAKLREERRRRTETRAEELSSGRFSACYPPQMYSYPFYKARVCEALTRLADEPVWWMKPDAIRRRELALRLCGRFVKARACKCCGGARHGTGRPDPYAHDCRPCNARSCPFCARRKARKQAAELAAQFEKIEVPTDSAYGAFGWKLITLTTKRDPRDPEAHTPAALRSRVKTLAKIREEVWHEWLGFRREGKRGGKVPIAGTALFWSIELAGTGHVHMHMIYLGPYIPKPLLDSLAAGVDESAGFTDVVERDSRKAAYEAAKYACKSPGGMAEDWLCGQKREVMNPELAARWEIGTYALRMQGCKGLLYDMDVPEDDESDDASEPDDSAISCEGCGTVGKWFWKTFETQVWIRACHAIDQPAFERSRWLPRGERFWRKRLQRE